MKSRSRARRRSRKFDRKAAALPAPLAWLLRDSRRVVALVGLVTLASAAAVGLSLGIHEPRYHDESSHLLAADTFSRGRLTNPPHPMWKHFETFHVLQQPTHASKYLPLQGMVLAAGQVLTGHPIAGTWLAAAAMCAAIAWMLAAWFPPGWVLIGGLLVAARIGVVAETGGVFDWSQSYWGGALAATGGALVLGALPRILAEPRASTAAVLGLGAAMLAINRPFEGMVVCLPVLVLLARRIVRGDRPATELASTILLPPAAILTLTLGWLAYYNWRITGDPLTLPYLLFARDYLSAPTFVFQELREVPEHRHPIMRAMDLEEVQLFESQRDLRTWHRVALNKLGFCWHFYLGWFLTLPLVMAPRLMRDRWMRFCLLTVALMIGSILTTTFGFPHYVAPATGALFALVVGGLRELDALRWSGRRIGRLALVLILLATAVDLGARIRAHPTSIRDWQRTRALLAEKLIADGGDHLVLVRYREGHSTGAEWVYNEADIDGSRVIWAREIDPTHDRSLIAHFPDRSAWLVDVTPTRIDFKAHPLAAAPSGSETTLPGERGGG